MTRRTIARRTVLKSSVASSLAAGFASDSVGTALGRSQPNTERGAFRVVVVGGGLAGVCAAIAAARNGASVALVQDRPVLGGNASSEIRMHISGADCSGGRRGTDARESGIIEEIKLEESARNPQRSASMLDIILYEKVLRERNITLFLNTSCDGVEMEGARIKAVRATRPSTEESFRLEGEMFLDCSGDGRLGKEAGADFRHGRESKDEYGESMAVQVADNQTLPSTLLFVSRKHDRPMPFAAPDWIRTFRRCEDLPFRGHRQFEYGYWWVELGGDLDTVKDNEKIRHELLRTLLGIWDHIKNQVDHGAENWALEWVGMIPGKRESRRFLGDYVLRQQDLQTPIAQVDRVAYGGWPLDLHPPRGIDDAGRPNVSVSLKEFYDIPLRSLYSRNVTNMFMAGRNVSTTHVAFGSTRVMATCAVMGQAVGTAAAACCKWGLTPRRLVQEKIRELQQQLLRDDAYLLNLGNEDPGDLCRKAQVAVSSETPEGPGAMVQSGVTRGIGRTSHRWISDPAAGFPQALTFRWNQRQKLSEVILTFDSNLSQPLALSHSDGFTALMQRGPQPETVRDYVVEAHSQEGWAPVAEVRDNYQRRRKHNFDPVAADALRVTVRATNGSPSARVFEVRAYS